MARADARPGRVGVELMERLSDKTHLTRIVYIKISGTVNLLRESRVEAEERLMAEAADAIRLELDRIELIKNADKESDTT